jgi:hypothetical protein
MTGTVQACRTFQSGNAMAPPRFDRSLVLLLLAGLAQTTLAAEASKAPRPAPVDVPHVQGEIKVDGKLDEAFWQQANQVQLGIETRPGENTPADVKTTVYIAENGQNLLIAFVAEDPDPKQIRAFLRDRDKAYDDDFVGIVVDTFDDERRAYEFFVNPLGAQMDLIQDDANGNEDDSWDGLWDSAGQITSTGFVVEMEIPFSTMRFQSGKDVQQWGADFLRFRPRGQRYRLSANKMDRNIPCYLCQIGRIRGFAGVKPGSNLEIAPTVTMRYSQQRANASDNFQSEGIKFDPGIDVKWGPTPNMTLNATINPDFSQVEADSAQLDVNNTFALFFPEKRPFFLDGADYFATPNQLVYTRNVNDPDIGLRVTGRSGPQTYGVFVASDTVTDLLLPGVNGSSLTRYDTASNDGAFRYRYDLNKQASIGAIATMRTGDDYRNVVEGVDGRWQQGSHTLTGQWIHTATQDPGMSDSFSGDAHSVEYDYGTRNWNAFVLQNQFDDGFRADLGFIGQVGYVRNRGGLTRHWYGDKDATFNHISLTTRWDESRTSDGTLLELVRESWVGANGPLQSYLELGHVDRDKEWNGVRFNEHISRFYGEFKPMSGVYLSLFTRQGDRVDLSNTKLGKVTTIQPTATINIGRSLGLSINHNYERLSRDGGNVYVANLTDLRISYQFSLRQRLRLAILRSDLVLDPSLFATPTDISAHQRSINTQLIYSYKINPRTALYAGYADGYFGGNVLPGTAEDPLLNYQSVFQTDRTLFLKIGYAWER